MSESAILFPEIRSYTGMSSSIDDSATTLYPEIRSSMDESAIVDPEIRSYKEMNSRLYMAAQEGDVNALNKLIQEINIFEQFIGLGNSVLHRAISCRDLQFVRRVLEEVRRNNNLVAGREFVRAKNSDGNSALHLAAFHGIEHLVEDLVLVMKGDVEDGNSALHLAEFFRSQNREGNTALHQAAKSAYYHKGIYFESSHRKGIYVKIVEVLLKHNHDLINMQNKEGESALFVASQKGRTWIVEDLLRLPACNSNMKRGDGQTPLHAAVLNGRTGPTSESHVPDHHNFYLIVC